MDENQCPEESKFRDLIAGELSDSQVRSLEVHLSMCDGCQRRLELLTDGPPTNVAAETIYGQPSDRLQEVIQGLKKDGTRGDEASSEAILLRLLQHSDAADTIGRLNEYEVKEVIGQGGMGLVVKAHDGSLDRTVAIKLLLPEFAMRAESRERFMREAKAAASIQHPNVVTVHAVGEFETTPYIVMEYIDGDTLTDMIARKGKLPYEEVGQIAVDILKGLEAAHQRGLIHRDIKPSNVLIDPNTHSAKITDFGLVKAIDDDHGLTVSGTIAGTPEFMSPEQATAQLPLDARSDLFSLGTLLYLALAGSSPFRASSTVATLRRVCDEPHPSLRDGVSDVPTWFADVVHRLLEKSPTQRYQTAMDVLIDLQAGLSNPGVRPLSGRPRWRAAGIAVSALMLIGALMWAIRWVDRNTDIETGFQIVGSRDVHESLEAVLGAAADGDVIEIFGDVEFPTDSLTIDKRNITLRAATDSLPRFLMPPGESARGPMITASHGLTIEGITFKWSFEAQRASSFEGCVVASRSGNLTVTNCAFETAGRCTGLGVGGSANVRNSRFRTPNGSGILFIPTGESNITVENCLFGGRVATTIAGRPEDVEQATAGIRMVQNSIGTEIALYILPSSGSGMLFEVRASSNRFDVQSHVLGYAGLRRRRASTPAMNELKRWIRWPVDDGNEYRPDSRLLEVTYRNGGLASSIDDYATWREFWELEDNAMSPTAPIGVDESILGPGETFDRFRQLPAYAGRQNADASAELN